MGGEKSAKRRKINIHANKSCPEIAARMGADTMDTVLKVSENDQNGQVEATPVRTVSM